MDYGPSMGLSTWLTHLTHQLLYLDLSNICSHFGFFDRRSDDDDDDWDDRRQQLLNLDLSNICAQFILFDRRSDGYDDYDRRQQL